MDLPCDNLILFDGVCGLCNRSVDLVLRNDPRAVFRFAPLQSPLGSTTLGQYGLPGDYTDSIVLIENGEAFCGSTAALRIARRLRGAWPLMSLLILVPPPLRDTVYDFIATHRYRWFGKSETCRMPTAETRDRFLG